MDIGDTLSFLRGGWRVERRINDHLSGVHGRFAGTATLVEVPSPDDTSDDRRALYEESGEIRIGTFRGPATRSLDYLQLPDATVMLSFADGRSFIDLDLRGGAWQSIHHCGEDHYEIAFVVSSLSEVQERWYVWGPNKRYTAATILRRIVPFDGR